MTIASSMPTVGCATKENPSWNPRPAEGILSPVQRRGTMARWGAVTRLRPLVLLLLAGCVPASRAREEAAWIYALQDDDRVRRGEAFQELLRANASIPELRRALGAGAAYGFPVVALLYAQGRGDAVPLDFRALHLAGFEWPAATSSENGVVEPYVKLEIEQDLARTGRPALRPRSEEH